MSAVFKEFNSIMNQRQRATLAYRPQANGQQERAVKTVIRSVKLYVEDPDQKDWDYFAEKLMFAINTSYDYTRKDTPAYLLFGWDPRTTIDTMIPSVRGNFDSESPEAWRRKIKREYEFARKWAEDLQKELKKYRADIHNKKASKKISKRLISKCNNNNNDQSGANNNIQTISQESSDTKAEFPVYNIGDSVWLYIEKVKPGYSRKLAHLWHGPFRIKQRISDFIYELDLSENAEYRFHPKIHISRLKLRSSNPQRPTIELVDSTLERFDFDEALLPEDSFEQLDDDEFIVEKVLESKMMKKTRFGRTVKYYLIKWQGYSKPTWEPESNLSCGGLIYDFEKSKRMKNRFKIAQVADEE